jgi:hypothetical protein
LIHTLKLTISAIFTCYFGRNVVGTLTVVQDFYKSSMKKPF